MFESPSVMRTTLADLTFTGTKLVVEMSLGLNFGLSTELNSLVELSLD
jgi:hypothetical protein